MKNRATQSYPHKKIVSLIAGSENELLETFRKLWLITINLGDKYIIYTVVFICLLSTKLLCNSRI